MFILENCYGAQYVADVADVADGLDVLDVPDVPDVPDVDVQYETK